MSLIDEIKLIKEQYKETILALPNVLGVGIGYRSTEGRTTDELRIKVLVRQKLPPAGLSSKAIAPREIGGVRTDVMQVGDIRALLTRSDRWRPAPGGVSVGHYKISAGTLGCLVYDRASGARMILSNNHVLANTNDASPGEAILQPGAADGGKVEQDTIARLERFAPIQFGEEPATCNIATTIAELGNMLAGLTGASHQLAAYQYHPQAANLVDAAIARPVDEADVTDEIIDIGVIEGVREAVLGMDVRKSGRTSGTTTGEITVIDATVNVSYGSGRSTTFENQIVSSAMSQGGDSGSLLVAGSSQQAVGLLFAGSDVTTIHSPIQTVLDALDVDITPQRLEKSLDQDARIEKAKAIKDLYTNDLMSKANVVGVGLGLRSIENTDVKDVTLVVMVNQKVPKAQLSREDLIPEQIEGIPVYVKEVGKIEAQND